MKTRRSFFALSVRAACRRQAMPLAQPLVRVSVSEREEKALRCAIHQSHKIPNC